MSNTWSAQDVAQKLDKSRQSGNGWIACCPAHEDKNPSLSISDGNDGKILVKCHSGCSQESVISELRSLGAWPEPEKSIEPSTQKKRIIATYDYVNEHGELVYQQVRYDPKDFRQRRPHQDGGWIWGLSKGIYYRNIGKKDWYKTKPKWGEFETAEFSSCAEIPYRLNDILSTSKGIAFVEGEKDADNLARIGVCATNGRKWKKSFNKYIKDRACFVIKDNDPINEKTGLRPGDVHAQTCLNIINEGAPKTLKMIDLGLPDGQDVSDWINNGGNKSSLAKIIADADEWAPTENTRLITVDQSIPEKSDLIPNWRKWLVHKKDEDTLDPKSPMNAKLLIQFCNKLQGCFAFNDFASRVEVLSPLPWDTSDNCPRSKTDEDAIECMCWLERFYGIKQTKNQINDAIDAASKFNRYNPLQGYLDGLKWDGLRRVDAIMTDYFGAQDEDYSVIIGRSFMISAVARALDPGCKVDTMVIFEGPQGAYKSTAIRTLFGAEFYTDELGDLGSKDASLQIQGVWAVEMAELSTLSRAESSRIKEWLTRRTDRFRPPFGRGIIEKPRGCILVGTVNPEGGYLKDATGARRFWPIQVGKIDIKKIHRDRDQLWAEAVQLYKNKETRKWWLSGDAEKIAVERQADRYETDPWADVINEFIDLKKTSSVSEILNDCLKIPHGQQNRGHEMRVGKHLTSVGWGRKRTYHNGKRAWIYENPKFK